MTWLAHDTWIVVIGALCAIACAAPGTWLVLRGGSMMGDAISHAVLPGLAAAWIIAGSRDPLVMFLGAAVTGVLTAVFTEWIQRFGRVDRGAATGVVFTVLFAIGLVMIVRAIDGDRVDLDADCVLHGSIEVAPLDRVTIAGWAMPRAVPTLAFAAAVNLLAIGLSWKELRFASFDGDGARTSGIPAGRLQLMLMTLTAVTAVAAFEVLGSILVVAMIVVPGAAAHLLTDRLGRTMAWALGIGVASAGLGHVAANGMNAGLERIGWQPTVSSAAPMCVVLGLMLGGAMLLAPQRGFVARAIDRVRLRARILDEDVLAALYRLQEHGRPSATVVDLAGVLRAAPRGVRRSAQRLERLGRVEPVTGADVGGHRLTDNGERLARRLVRSHRLWEAWLHETVGVAADHVHGTAHMMEHVTRGALRDELEAAAAGEDRTDPHGRAIP